jgi:hypothetical protein
MPQGVIRRMMNARGFGDCLCRSYLAAMKENRDSKRTISSAAAGLEVPGSARRVVQDVLEFWNEPATEDGTLTRARRSC